MASPKPRPRASSSGEYAWNYVGKVAQPKKKRRRRPRSYTRARLGNARRSVFKLYLGLTLVCLMVASIVGFVAGRGPDMLQSIIRKQIHETIAEEGERLKGELKKDLADTDIEELKEKYKKYIN